LAVEAGAAKADAAQAAADAAAASEDVVLEADASQQIVPSKDSADLDSDRDPIG
jgi:hypothetical protein